MNKNLKQCIGNAIKFIKDETGVDTKGILKEAQDSLESINIGDTRLAIGKALDSLEELKVNITDELKELMKDYEGKK